MKKRLIAALCTFVCVCILLAFAQALVTPKYISNAEGALTREYYAEAGGHDVLFVGDCEVYESFIPAVLWEKYGISSYVRGNAQQLVWQSYYLLEEAFKYEKPSVVVFNVLALKYGTPQNEAYNRMTLDGMRWSASKLSAIKASMTAEEKLLDYLFPLLRFHSRITALEREDFKYILGSPAVSHSGYLMKKDIVPMTQEQDEGRELLDYTLPASAMEYLDKMHALCVENGAELVLIKSPTNSWGYWWYDEWDEQIVDYAEENDLAYYNFIDEVDAIGIDYTTDTYDAGVHLNVYGAEKMTEYFGNILATKHGLDSPSHASDEIDAWAERVAKYYDERNG